MEQKPLQIPSGGHCISSNGDSTAIQFIGRDPSVLDILDEVMLVADTDATVLITGESGTGKELIARNLHMCSSRAHAAFVAVNCGAFSETLQESEMFGHVQGAFTGAAKRKQGKFEAADGGTIFLDEISEMPRALQTALLRILQSGEYAPVGSAENCYCDTRIIAATNRDLKPLIDAGTFRHDLYYRLKIIELNLPPLRARQADIPLLIEHFVSVFSRAYRRPIPQVSLEARELLMLYDFPGNVRELEHIVQRAMILCDDGCISPCHLPTEVLPKPNLTTAIRSVSSKMPPALFHNAKARVVETFERDYLTARLAECGGIVSRAAERSGLSERTFREKLKKLGISWKHFRNGLALPEDVT